MPDPRTPNRNYPVPHEDNTFADELARFIDLANRLDIDVAGALAGLAGKANVAALAAYVPLAQVNVPNGVAGLNASGQIDDSAVPPSMAGGMRHKGAWNALTNSPAIPAAADANNGWYYRVTTAGVTAISGIAEWDIGDWIVSNGAAWYKIDNTDKVLSVAGKTGAVLLDAGDIVSGTLAEARLPERLRGATQTVTDWNAATESGFYKALATAANAPSAAAYTGLTTQYSPVLVLQELTAANYAAQSWRRLCVAGVWGSWERMWTGEAELDSRFGKIVDRAWKLITSLTVPAGTAAVDLDLTGWRAIRINVSNLRPETSAHLQMRMGTGPSTFIDWTECSTYSRDMAAAAGAEVAGNSIANILTSNTNIVSNNGVTGGGWSGNIELDGFNLARAMQGRFSGGYRGPSGGFGIRGYLADSGSAARSHVRFTASSGNLGFGYIAAMGMT